MRRLVPFAVVATLLVLAVPADAAQDRWSSGGPQGGAAYSIAINPRDPRVLYAGANGGIFNSVDGGRDWYPVTDRITDALLAIDPLHPRTVYAAADGVWKSTDAGATWTKASTGLPNFTSDFTPARPLALGIDPVHPSTLYLGAENSGFTSDCDFGWDVYRTTDGAAHWTHSSRGMDAKTNDGDGQMIASFTIDPVHPARVYAASAGTSCDSLGGVFETIDRGRIWTRADDGIRGRPVYAVTVDPEDDSILYAGTSAGVFKSTDGGASWFPSNAGMGASEVTSLVVDPANDVTVYAGTLDGLYKSTDGGATWVSSSNGLDGNPVEDLVLDQGKTSSLYAASQTPGVVYRSTDSASTWTGAQIFFGTSWSALVASPSKPRFAYAVTFDAVARTRDGGATWTFGSDGLPPPHDAQLCALAVDPNDHDVAYVGTTGRGAYKTVDGGKTWQPANAGIRQLWACSLAVDPQRPNIVWVGGSRQSSGVYESMDGGETWEPRGNGISNEVGVIAVDPHSSSTVYASSLHFCCKYRNGLYKSTDEGRHWIRMSPKNPPHKGFEWPPGISSVVIAPSRHDTLYATNGASVWRSTDGAKNWTLLAGPRLAKGVAITQLAISPKHWRVVFAASTYGVWRSFDGGRTWSKWNKGLGVHQTTGIAVVAAHAYVSTGGGGIWQRAL